MSDLSSEQIYFLYTQGIPISKAFNAENLGKNEYNKIMEEDDMMVAYNVTPCKSKGHTLRTKYGHCVQCNTQSIAFISRYSQEGVVYLAYSSKLSLCKVGTCKDINNRLRTLNSHGYGGANDWIIFDSFPTENAARIELNIQNAVEAYKCDVFYKRTGKTIKCQEIYKCQPEVLLKILLSYKSGDN